MIFFSYLESSYKSPLVENLKLHAVDQGSLDESNQKTKVVKGKRSAYSSQNPINPVKRVGIFPCKECPYTALPPPKHLSNTQSNNLNLLLFFFIFIEKKKKEECPYLTIIIINNNNRSSVFHSLENPMTDVSINVVTV